MLTEAEQAFTFPWCRGKYSDFFGDGLQKPVTR